MMYKRKSRIISVLLSLCMLVSLCAGLMPQCYAYSDRNTGTRHVLCTALSSQAKEYYTGEYEWDKMSALSGVNTNSSLAAMQGKLYKQLHELMYETKSDSVSYKSLTSYWKDTDASGGSSNAIMFYSDTFETGYNREHVWPKSRGSFYQKNAGSDLHHLRPTNTDINSKRGNHTMGNVVGVCSSYDTIQNGGKTVLYLSSSNDLVEVNDNIKGDVARILLYVYTCWGQPNLCENVSSSNLPSRDSDDSDNNGLRVINDLDTLLEWCELDPVDTWEMSRNDCVENIQGNRNVFIDYPEYAWLIFGRDVPDEMPTPSGNFPGTGGGGGGEARTVKASFSAPCAIEDITASAGSAITLPDCGAEIEDYAFVGWSLSEVSDVTAKPTFYNAGARYTLNEDTVFYALYAKELEGTGGGLSSEAVYVGTEPESWNGTYVIAVKDEGVMMNNDNSKGVLEYDSAEFSGDKVTNAGSGNAFTFSKVGSYYSIQDSSGKYLMCSTVKKLYLDDSLSSVSESDGDYLWSISVNGIKHKNSSCGSLQYNSQSPRFTTYTSSQHQVELYRLGEAAVVIYSTFKSQSHTHSYVPEVTEPTCTEKGYTTYTCKCGDSYIADYTDPLGHSYDAVVTDPTCEEKGYTTHTCTRCMDSYVDSYVDPLGHDYRNGYCTRCAEPDPDFCPQDRFADKLPLEHWAHESVDYVLMRGIMSGTGDTTFEPSGTVTRAMVVNMLYNLSNEPSHSGVNPFTDIPADAWYADAVIWASENEIVSGYDDGSFNPNGSITREQLAIMMMNYAGYIGADVSADYDLTDFEDADTVSPWAADAVKWAVANGIVNGSDEGGKLYLAPQGTAIRAQIAVIFENFCEKFGI